MNTDLFTGLWEVIKELLRYVKFITFVDAWDEGVLLRRGTYVRVLKPGVVYHWPFLDELHFMNVKPTALELEEQSLTTSCGRRIVCRGVLMWGIKDIYQCIVEVEDAESTLADIAVGVIQELVEVTRWEDITHKEFRQDVRRAVQKQAKEWGIKVSTFKFQDLTEARSYRLFGSHA